MEDSDIRVSCNEKEFSFKKNDDVICKDIEGIISDQGRLFAVDVNLYKVLCNKTIAIGVLVYEGEILRGFKVKQVYTGKAYGYRYRDINSGKIYFVFPEEDVSKERNFKVKVIANYINLNI